MDDRVQHIRLINGDEIIGTVLESTDTHVTVDQPLIVTQQNDEQSNKFVALIKYLPYADVDVAYLQKSHVMVNTDLHPDIIKYYYLSLKLNRRAEDNTITYIRQANQMMENLLTGERLQLESKVAHIQPVSDTKH